MYSFAWRITVNLKFKEHQNPKLEYRVVLNSSLPNTLKPVIKSSMKMYNSRQAMIQPHLSEQQVYCQAASYMRGLMVYHCMPDMYLIDAKWHINSSVN